jgi:hypothetical protein
MEDTSNLPPERSEAERRHPTMKMAKLAVHNMMQEQKRRTSKKDFISELMLPLSCVLLAAAISFPAGPWIKALAFMPPMLAFAYYIYRRIGIIGTLETRQAALISRLLIGCFMFGGTFALFGIYVFAFIAEKVVHPH